MGGTERPECSGGTQRPRPNAPPTPNLDIYDDRLKLVPYLDWTGRGACETSRTQARRHVLAGDRRRVCRRDEGSSTARRAVVAKLGDLVLYVLGPLHQEVEPQSMPTCFSLVKLPKRFTFNDESIRAPAWNWSLRLRRTPKAVFPTTPGFSAAGRSTAASPPSTTRGPAGAAAPPRDAARLVRLPDARAASGPDHPRWSNPATVLYPSAAAARP